MGVRFDNTYRLCTTALKIFGAHPTDDSYSAKWIILNVITYIASGATFLSLVYSSFFESFAKICANLSIAIFFLIVLFNHGALIVYKKELNEVIKMAEDDLERTDALSSEFKTIVTAYIERGKKVSKIWYWLCIITGISFLFEPLIFTIYSAVIGNFKPVHMLEVVYPPFIEEIKDRVDIYLIIYFIHSYYLFFSSIVYTAFYSLGTILELHACGQIELIIGQLENLFPEKNIDVTESRKIMKDVAFRIDNIYRFVDLIQKTHEAPYEVCLKSATIFIPITCFGVIEDYSKGIINFNLLGSILGFLVQCFIPCYYCNLLLTKGENLRLAVYQCGWERHWDSSSRSAILLMLTRTSRPLAINAVFFRVSLHAFKNVCQQAYTIFNVMNAARK